MVQNRNKLIDLFVGNISNAIVHEILKKAIDKDEIVDKYKKEIINSLDKAKEYREKINPKHVALPDEDIADVKNKIMNKVRSELNLRISKGYGNIDLDLVEGLVDDFLKNTNII